MNLKPLLDNFINDVWELDYVYHKQECDLLDMYEGSGKCDCGLESAIKELKEHVQGLVEAIEKEYGK